MKSLVQVSRALNRAVGKLSFSEPVTHVYNPLEYARRPHEIYLERFGARPKEVLLVGMNPGPFGMAQTGIPFGDVGFVRDWMGIEAKVDRPTEEHPKRPVLGFDCGRSEVSGSRLWGWARDTYGARELFFERYFVANYCPLVFMEHSGRNRVPEKLPKAERDPLFAACDAALRRTVEHLEPKFVVGVGKFAEKKAKQVVGDLDVVVGSVPHPSPASPLANRGWAPLMTEALTDLGVL